MFEPAKTVALEISGIADSIKKGKNITYSLLHAGYSLANNNINVKPSSLLMGSGITLTMRSMR